MAAVNSLKVLSADVHLNAPTEKDDIVLQGLNKELLGWDDPI
jgi:hypothetical protein